MRILILGAGKMGSFFCDLLSFDHDVAVYDADPAASASPTIAAALPRSMKSTTSIPNR